MNESITLLVLVVGTVIAFMVALGVVLATLFSKKEQKWQITKRM